MEHNYEDLPPLQKAWDQSTKSTFFFKVADFVLLANIKFTFKWDVKVKICLANKFAFVVLGLQFVLHFLASSFELKWEDLFLKYYNLVLQITSRSTVEVKTLQAQISPEYSFSICQNKNVNNILMSPMEEEYAGPLAHCWRAWI